MQTPFGVMPNPAVDGPVPDRVQARRRILQWAKKTRAAVGDSEPRSILDFAMNFIGTPQAAGSQFVYNYGQHPEELRAELEQMLARGHEEGWLE